MAAIGYLRVSTEEQVESGAGLAAQRAAITAEALRRGTDVAWYEDAGQSARTLRRPAMERALAALRSQEADTLIVAKLDRLSRSVLDFAGLIQEAERSSWNIVVLDLGLDLATPQGRFTAHVLSAMAELERELIGQRTREALAVKRAQGVKLGRPRMTAPEVAARIMHQHEDGGESFFAIAAALNREGVPTPNGGKAWYPSTVGRIVARERQVVE